MKNTLAENLLRFGVKNLNESLTRTLLNEGLKAGSEVRTTEPNQTQVDQSNWAPELANTFAKYKGINAGGIKGDTFFSIAATAAFWQKYNADKKFQKQINKTNTEYWSSNPANSNFIMQIASGIQYNKQTVDVYPYPKNPGFIATIGAIGSAGSVVKRVDQSYSYYNSTIRYMNAFNIENVGNYQTAIDGREIVIPDFNQYDLTQMVDQNNYLNLFQTTIAANSLIFYSAGDKQPNVAGKETGTTVVGATEPMPKQYDVSFNTDSAAIPTGDPEIARAVQDAIAMFPDGNITNLTVISSASPEYNKNAGGPKTLADYGQRPVTGTGKPAAGTDFISKNIELAYNRGVSFMNALNAGLKAQGKPEVANYTVQWQISDKGGSKVPGRYAEVKWEKAGTPGKQVGTMQSTGTTGDTINGKETFNIFQHTFSW